MPRCPQFRRSNSGSLAMLAAMRRAYRPCVHRSNAGSLAMSAASRCRRHCAPLQTSSNISPRLSFLFLPFVNVRYHASPVVRSMPPMMPMSTGGCTFHAE